MPLPAVAPQVPWLQHSGQAVDSGEVEYRGDISIVFGAIVRGIALSSTGALYCYGFLGRMIGFRRGVEVARSDNTLIDPSDCGADSITFGVQGQLSPDAGVDSLVIQGVNPWTFPVMGNCCGRALLKYTITYQSFVGVVCDSVSRGQMTTCRLGIAVDSTSQWSFKGALPTRLSTQQDTVQVISNTNTSTWVGKGVLPGIVSAVVSVGGQVDTLRGNLMVTNRSGPSWRWSDANWTYRQDGPVRCTTLYGDFVIPASTALSANRPTAQRVPGSCGAPGGVGNSIEPNPFAAPDSGFVADSVDTGPNAGLLFVASASYYMDRTAEMNPFIREGGRADTLTNSNDQRVCRHALGLGSNVPVVVSFYTYNTVCQGFNLTPMFNGLWSHEGFGTQDSLNPAVANGHEARRRIAARDTLNDPYRATETIVNLSRSNLIAIVADSLIRADSTITLGADPGHVFVKNNYIQSGGKCGEAWVLDTMTTHRYQKIQVGRMVNGILVCL